MADNAGRGRRAPWKLLFRGRRGLATGVILTAISLHAIDVFVMSTVMPSVVAEIGGAAFYAWPTAIYMVATIVGSASAGPIQAGQGLRFGYIMAAGLFGIGALIGGSAPSIGVLIAGRAVQGWGGGLLLALSYVLVRTLYADRLRPRLFAVLSTLWGAAAIVGPAVGGIFAEIDWWRGAFWCQVPITLLFIVLAWRVVPRRSDDGRATTFPVMAITLLCGGAMAVAAAGNVAQAGGKAALLATGAGMFVLALWRDRGGANPMFPSRAFVPAVAPGALHWVFLLIAMAPTGVGIFLPLAMQTLHGYTPLAAGYFGCLLALGWTTSAITVSGLHDAGVRRVMIAGPFLTASSLIAASLLIDDAAPWVFGPLLVTAGCGIGMCLPHYTTRIMRVARRGEEAVTASSVTTVRSLGVAFGSALAGMIANLAGLTAGLEPEAVARASHWVLTFAGCAPLLAGCIAVWLVATHGRELGLARR